MRELIDEIREIIWSLDEAGQDTIVRSVQQPTFLRKCCHSVKQGQAFVDIQASLFDEDKVAATHSGGNVVIHVGENVTMQTCGDMFMKNGVHYVLLDNDYVSQAEAIQDGFQVGDVSFDVSHTNAMYNGSVDVDVRQGDAMHYGSPGGDVSQGDAIQG